MYASEYQMVLGSLKLTTLVYDIPKLRDLCPFCSNSEDTQYCVEWIMGKEKEGGDKVSWRHWEPTRSGRLPGAPRQMLGPALGGGREGLRAGPPGAQAQWLPGCQALTRRATCRGRAAPPPRCAPGRDPGPSPPRAALSDLSPSVP